MTIDERRLADFTDMRRTMEQTNEIHVLEGRACPRPGCEGTISRKGNEVLCDTCDRLIVRFF